MICPVSGDEHDKCFLTKMKAHIGSVHNMPTVLPSLFPIISELVEKNVTGIFNFVNKGGDLFTRFSTFIWSRM